jgi:Protein of unknown function (DUF3102)
MTEVEKSLGKLADEINAEHRAFVGTFHKTVEHGIRAGELLAKAKEQCPHGTWLPWLKENFEGAPRTAQEYMRLYNRRDELRAKTRDSAHLSVSDALKELAAPSRPEGIPPEEWAIVKHATEQVGWLPAMDVERLARLEEGRRRGFVAQMAWEAMIAQGRAYSEIMDYVREAATPELLAKAQAEANELRWWVEQVEWIEQLVRACDWPPGRGMPSAAFDEKKKDLPLSRLYGEPLQQQYHDALQSPRDRIREFCGPVV